MALLRALVVIVSLNLLFLEPLAANDCNMSRLEAYFTIMHQVSMAKARELVSFRSSSTSSINEVACILQECNEDMSPGCVYKLMKIIMQKQIDDRAAENKLQSSRF